MAVSTKKAPAFKPPKNMAECADLLYSLKQRRAAIVKDAKKLETDEKALKKHIIDNLPKSKAEGVSGKVARVQIELKSRPSVEDRKKLEAYIRKTGDFELLGLALNNKAVEERWADKKKIPGIGKFSYKTISLHKL